MLQIWVPAIEEDGQAGGACGPEELGDDVDERDADVTDKDDRGPNGTSGVQAGPGVWTARDGSSIEGKANGEWSGISVTGLWGHISIRGVHNSLSQISVNISY